MNTHAFYRIVICNTTSTKENKENVLHTTSASLGLKLGMKLDMKDVKRVIITLVNLKFY